MDLAYPGLTQPDVHWQNFEIEDSMMIVVFLSFFLAAICFEDGEEPGKTYAGRLRRSLENGTDEQSISLIMRAKYRPIHSSTFVKILLEVVNAPNPESLRGQAASAIGKMCPESESVLISKELMTLAQFDSSSQVREGAVMSLGDLNLDTNELVAALLVAANDSDPNVRGECYRSLGSKRQLEDKILELLKNATNDRGMEWYALSNDFYSERPRAVRIF